jgi:short subunit dehydrogenase-like uncharacterized protein
VRKTGPVTGLPEQMGPIALYGATGYTGRLVAAELGRAGADFILSGRDRAKLERLASTLEGSPPVRAVKNDDAAGLRQLFGDCAAVITCAGPFGLHGEPVLAAAIESGTHYLDTTGEQPHIKLALERYGPAAEQKGVAVLPAMGFDYVPGDLLAALTAAGMGPLENLKMAYATDFRPTRGTMLSALEMLRGGDFEWRQGGLEPASHRAYRGSFDFGAPLGRKTLTHYPAGEHLTVPRHVDTRQVETGLSADSVMPRFIAPLSPLVTRSAGIFLNTPIRPAIARLVDRLPEGASPEDRASARFTLVCEAAGERGTRRGRVTGRDVYGLTAALITRGARIAAGGGIGESGGLAPAEAFDPRGFLESFGRFSLEFEVDPLPA